MRFEKALFLPGLADEKHVAFQRNLFAQPIVPI